MKAFKAYAILFDDILFQFDNLDPNVLTPITVQPPNAQVSMIVIETVKPQNCSIIQGIAIDQCCEKGAKLALFVLLKILIPY